MAYSSSSVLNKENQIETIDIIYPQSMRKWSEYVQLNSDIYPDQCFVYPTVFVSLILCEFCV